MQNLSDKDLDKLFQSAAEGYDPGSSAEGWKDMEKRMALVTSQSNSVLGIKNWRGVTIVSSTIVLSSLITWVAVNQENPNELKKENQIESKLNPTKNNEEKTNLSSETQAAGNKELNHPQTSAIDGINQRPNIKTDNKGTSRAIGKRIELSTDNTTGNKQESISFLSQGPVEKENSNSNESNFLIIQNDRVENSDRVEVRGMESKQDNKLIIKDNVQGDDQSLLPEDTLKKTDKQDDFESAQQNLNKDDQNKRQSLTESKWALRISASPDFSTVKFDGPYGSGSNYSLQVLYSIKNKFSISTGIIWSKKIYSAKNFEYSTPSGVTYTAENAEGDCDIIDIPLNVYYQIHDGRRFSWQGSLGFSSYLMLKEKYKYSWAGYDRYSEIKGENNELFKVMNISIVASKSFSKRFSLQAEPFVKIPLKGIGEGNIKLSSLGTFITLKYSLTKQSTL